MINKIAALTLDGTLSIPASEPAPPQHGPQRSPRAAQPLRASTRRSSQLSRHRLDFDLPSSIRLARARSHCELLCGQASIPKQAYPTDTLAARALSVTS